MLLIFFQLLEAFKQEAMKKTGINSETIDKPVRSFNITPVV